MRFDSKFSSKLIFQKLSSSRQSGPVGSGSLGSDQQDLRHIYGNEIDLISVVCLFCFVFVAIYFIVSFVRKRFHLFGYSTRYSLVAMIVFNVPAKTHTHEM